MSGYFRGKKRVALYVYRITLGPRVFYYSILNNLKIFLVSGVGELKYGSFSSTIPDYTLPEVFGCEYISLVLFRSHVTHISCLNNTLLSVGPIPGSWLGICHWDQGEGLQIKRLDYSELGRDMASHHW